MYIPTCATKYDSLAIYDPKSQLKIGSTVTFQHIAYKITDGSNLAKAEDVLTLNLASKIPVVKKSYASLMYGGDGDHSVLLNASNELVFVGQSVVRLTDAKLQIPIYTLSIVNWKWFGVKGKGITLLDALLEDCNMARPGLPEKMEVRGFLNTGLITQTLCLDDLTNDLLVQLGEACYSVEGMIADFARWMHRDSTPADTPMIIRTIAGCIAAIKVYKPPVRGAYKVETPNGYLIAKTTTVKVDDVPEKKVQYLVSDIMPIDNGNWNPDKDRAKQYKLDEPNAIIDGGYIAMMAYDSKNRHSTITGSSYYIKTSEGPVLIARMASLSRPSSNLKDAIVLGATLSS